jgi:hypothetical protein
VPGTLLLADLERNNSTELNEHLQSLLVPDVTQAPPPVQIAPAQPQQTQDELQAHLDSLLTPDASQAPPAQPAPAPEPVGAPLPTPAPTNVVDELASHVDNLTGGGLKLLGQGLSSLGQGAQEGVQAIGQGLTSLREPPAGAPVVSPTGPGTATPPNGPGPSGPLQDYARQAATRAGIDPDIFVRQIQQESGFNPSALSPAGASGVAQIVPRYHPGVDPRDPYASLDYAANLMKSNLTKYQGDYAKALAAYNAGSGAVDRFGGVPPFEETQRYVSTILSGNQPGPRPETEAAQALARTGGWAQQAERGRDLSQFGDSQLTADEATAACGPAAAVRFAQRFGRNPTLREATDLAKSVGWTSAQGMAGLTSEKALMDKMGVATKLVNGADWGTFANEARTGNPVTISTQGHYFTADGWDPGTNRFHVGRSGLDLRGGSEWMTPEQMTGIMGPVQGGLLADNPTVPASTVGKTEGFTAPVMQAASTGLQSLGEGLSSLGEKAGQGLQSLDQAVQTIGGAARDALTGAGQVMQQGQDVNVAGDVAAREATASAIGEAPGLSEADRATRRAALEASPIGQAYGSDIRTELLPNITEPGHPLNVMADLQEKYRDPSDPTGLHLTERMTPEDRTKYEGAMLALGGMAAPVAEGGAAAEAAGEAVARRAGGIDYDALANLRRSQRAQQPGLPDMPTAEPNLADRAIAFGVNNMLSNPASMVGNAISGGIETVKRPVVSALSGDLGAAGSDLRAMGLAVGDALADAGQTFATGRRASQVIDQPEAFGGRTGMLATPFLRTMGATDEFLRSVNAAGAQAAELVRLKRANPDLTQAELLDRFGDQILGTGQRAATEAVFESGGTGIGRTLAGARRQLTAPDATPAQRLGGAALNVLVPFSVIPDAILTRGARNLPLVNEAIGLGRLARGDVRGAGDAARRAALAETTNAAIWSQVLAGNVTGNGPDDPAKKRALMQARDEQGNPLWRPNSLRVGGQWIPYASLLGPAAIQVAFVANAVEQYEDSGRQVNPDVAKAFGSALGDTISDAWYLQTLSGAFSAIKNGTLPEWMTQQGLATAGRAIPEAGLLNAVRGITDPVQREGRPKLDDPGTWADYFGNRVPGVSPLVPPRIDPATGRPMQEPRDVGSLAFRATAPGEPNPVNEALARHNLGVGDAPTTITPAEGLTIALNDDEQRRFLELSGPEVEQRVLAMTRNASYQRAAPDQQRALLQDVINDGREVAAIKLFQALPKDEQLRRLREYEAAQKRQAEPSVRLP